MEGKLQELDVIVMQRHFEPYLPYGPQSNVPLKLSKTGGWRQCFSSFYHSGCDAPKIMLVRRMSSPATITSFAWGSREKVLSKTTNSADYEIENGVGWYYYQKNQLYLLEILEFIAILITQ